MSGRPEQIRSRPSGTAGAFAGGASLLVGAVLVLIGAAALLAFFTIDPPPLKAHQARARGPVDQASIAAAPVPASAPPPAFADDVVLPPAEEAPPPRSADVAGIRPADASASSSGTSGAADDWTTVPMEDLRTRANLNEEPAMEELARRLIGGVGIAQDPQAAAGWLIRAAELGSPQAAFNVGIMYERGFVVERNSTRAAQWYRRAAAQGLAVAKHNLALLLRDGRGLPRNGQEALDLLHSAARQGMSASMFTLGDIYEHGDAAPKDQAAALAWFAITAEFERQINHGSETPLGRTAEQRSQALQRTLTPAELQRAQELGQTEFRQIVEALSPSKPEKPAPPTEPPPAQSAPPSPTTPASPPPAGQDAAGWPSTAGEQVRTIQQLLVNLKLLHDAPDGVMGPLTRAAIRGFQRRSGLAESGEPTKEVYAGLTRVLASREVTSTWSLPPPPKAAATPKAGPPPSAGIGLATREPPPPPTSADIAQAPGPAVLPVAPAPSIDLGKSEGPPPPPRSADIARAPRPEPPPAAAQPAIELVESEPPPPPPRSADIARAPYAPANHDQGRPSAPQAPGINLGASAPPPPPPTSAEIAAAAPAAPTVTESTRPALPRIDPPPPPPLHVDPTKPEFPTPPPASETGSVPTDFAAWPMKSNDQIWAIQQLLRDLRFLREAPTGRDGPATRAAIREYQHTVGLKESGEPSKALFDSLKEMRALMAPKKAAAPPQ